MGETQELSEQSSSDISPITVRDGGQDPTYQKSYQIVALSAKLINQNGKINEPRNELVYEKESESDYSINSSLSHQKLSNSDSFIMEVVCGRMTPNIDDEKD